MEQIDRRQSRLDQIRVMDRVAAFVRRTGLATQVILPREPAIISAAREIAQHVGVTVSIALEADSVVLRFQLRAMDAIDAHHARAQD